MSQTEWIARDELTEKAAARHAVRMEQFLTLTLNDSHGVVGMPQLGYLKPRTPEMEEAGCRSRWPIALMILSVVAWATFWWVFASIMP